MFEDFNHFDGNGFGEQIIRDDCFFYLHSDFKRSSSGMNKMNMYRLSFRDTVNPFLEFKKRQISRPF